MADFYSLKVPELKQYLQERDVSCTLLRKIDLVRLCELAMELHLEIIPTDDGGDYNVMDKKRRTVQVNGDDIVIPSPTDVCSWQTQLNNMPDVQTYDILFFLLTYCKWENNRLQTYKSDNGFGLFSSNHIDDVQISPVLKHDYMYIKATCAPETRQNSIPYTTWLLVHQSGQVMFAGCTCVADNGTCKHCVALLFAVNDFCSRHKERGTEVRTDVECVWDKPRNESIPMEVDEIDIRTDTSVPKKITPIHTVYKSTVNNITCTTNDVKIKLKNICKCSKALLLRTQYEEGDDLEDESDSSKIPTVLDVVNSNVGENIFVCLQNAFDRDTINKIEEITRDQSENPEWFNHRKGRITASNFSSILSFKFTENDENYISKRVMGKSSFINTPSVNFGRENENVARQLYFLDYKKCYDKAKHELSGLQVDELHPYLGASPDGLISCKCCGEGLIEIKCSYMYQNKTPQEACLDHHYHVYLDENNLVKLKDSSSWYIQIQGQMGVCKKQWCDFILYTKKGPAVDRIYFDSELCEQNVKTSKRFYEKYIVKALSNKKINEKKPV